MVEHEGLLRKFPGERDGRRQLFREDQNVVGQIKLDQFPEAAQEIRPKHEVRVRLVLHHVPHAHKLRMLRQFRELFLDRLGPQFDPANHTFDHRRMIGERQQPVGFSDCLARLHGDTTVKSCLSQQRFEVFGQPIAVQRRAFGNPRILLFVVTPEMLM